ncbi:hypothetical protein Q0590_34975 [Rhodocytophaga aerolata]|uniref:Por secretion system C-terminal sorting domain-containing protein n=1 Tax=Rhodocytophaga aerolata TaxID=455078 RepID=A0ABT8RHH1_9BACT|nr:hypothetical protein [Rhodocytophaga aerolata]MDO1451529.1 hypothetical protein [Rhodocytophaga aerolata]
MKNFIPFISLFVYIVSFGTDGFSQTLSHTLPDQSANSTKMPQTSTSMHLAATVFQASDDPFSIRIHLENYGQGKVSIKLKSSTTLLHKEVIEHKTYARRYNMYNLPAGEYQIELKNEKQIYTKTVSIKNENGMRVLSII